MGNCQAVDAATLVIQHPGGKEDKLYWPITAREVMRSNPGHHVALLISTTLCPAPPANKNSINSGELPSTTASNSDTTNTSSCPVRLTKIKLLRPTDMLVLGHVYRLITTQEVVKGLKAKKQAKLKKGQAAEAEEEEKTVRVKHDGSGVQMEARRSHFEQENQVVRNERNRPGAATASSNHHSATARSRTWQPSLNSISEAAGS